MKKISLIAALSLIPSFAFADDFYASANIGIGKSKIKATVTGLESTSKNISPIVGELALGTYLSPSLRTEIAGSYLASSAKEFALNLKAKATSMAGMLNLYYDINGFTQSFTPYVMAGVGYARNTYKLSGDAATVFDKNSKSKGGVAYQAGLGFEYLVTDATRVGIGYRFRSTGSKKVAFTTTNGTAITAEGKLEPVHILLAGLRFDF